MKRTMNLKLALISSGVVVVLFVIFGAKHILTPWFYDQAMKDVEQGRSPANNLGLAMFWIKDDPNLMDQFQAKLDTAAGRLMKEENYSQAVILLKTAIPIHEQVWGKRNNFVKALWIKMIKSEINSGSYDQAVIDLQESIQDSSQAEERPDNLMYKAEDPIYKSKMLIVSGELMEEKGQNLQAEKLYRIALPAAELSMKMVRPDLETRNALWILARGQADLGMLLKNKVQAAFAAQLDEAVDCDKLLADARANASRATQMKVQDPITGLNPSIDAYNEEVGHDYRTDKKRVESLLGPTPSGQTSTSVLDPVVDPSAVQPKTLPFSAGMPTDNPSSVPSDPAAKQDTEEPAHHLKPNPFK